MVKRGLILAVILSFFCIQNAQASNVSYKYDSLSRLVEVLYENIGKIEYTYDAAGNRLSQKVTKLNNSTISVSPTNRDVSKDAGTTSFSVSNTGTGTISWTAAVTTGGSWLSITAGGSGSNSGTITCGYSANAATSSRIATIRVTVSGATGSPVDVTVTQAPTTTPTSGEYFKEDFSGSSTNTWTSLLGRWNVDNGKLSVDQIPSGKMAHYQTSFNPKDFFVIDTDVDVISIADGGAYGIYPFISGSARFDVNGKKLQGVGTIVISNGDAYLMGWDSLGENWYIFEKFATTPPVTSIGVAYSRDKISLRINKQNTTFFSGSFGAAVSAIDSLWLMAQGESTHVHFDNVYADPITTLMPAECTATLDANLSLHIPYLSYVSPLLGTLSLWADFIYVFNPASIIFKLTNAAIIKDPSFSCAPSTLSEDLNIHIPDFLLPDGSTHLWVDLKYSATLSTDGNLYFIVSNYGAVSN
ncbi:MAG: BACON domain-containing carbohydrate-binding protein [Pseudomonadota bacterium]